MEIFILRSKNHKMKTLKIITALAFAGLINTGVKAQTADKEQMIVPLSQPGKPYKLDVGLVDGSITVTGYEGKDIILEVQNKEEKRQRPKQHDGMHSLSSGG